jgi:hypothetical protein
LRPLLHDPPILSRTRRAVRERHLLTYGVGVVAEVQQVWRASYISFGTKNPYDVVYRFHDHTGRPVQGKDRTYHYAWAEALRPGDPVGVIYHPFRSTENVLWLHGSNVCADVQRPAQASGTGSC